METSDTVLHSNSVTNEPAIKENVEKKSETISICKKQLTEKYNLLMDLFNDSNFEIILNKNEIVVGKNTPSSGYLDFFKVYSHISAAPEELVDYVWKVYSSEESVKKWNPKNISFQVKEIESDVRVCYSVHASKWPAWPRDILFVQQKIVDVDRCCILMYSIESPLFPKRDDCYVRLEVNINGYIFEKSPNGSNVYLVGQSDPGGKIPKWLVNVISGVSYSKCIGKLRTAFRHKIPDSKFKTRN